MIDERRLRILETQVDALRTKEKDSESRKTYDEVFDHAALLTIADLITDGVISTLDYPVSTGKEANVFHATGPDGRAKAVKIYRIANATFRNIAVYIDGDPRFKRVKRAIRPTLFAWAEGVQESRPDGGRGRSCADSGAGPQQRPRDGVHRR